MNSTPMNNAPLKVAHSSTQWLLSALFAVLVVLMAAPAPAAPPAPNLDPEVSAQDEAAAASNSAYRAGREAIDSGAWKRAINRFGDVIDDGGDYADAALYWRAYAQVKAGEIGDARNSLGRLQREYPDSRWSDDARALEIEMRGPGQVNPNAADDDMELKLLALHSLMQQDSDRAVPMVRKILDGDGPEELRRQALFVLAHSGADGSADIVRQVALGNRHPELQREAIHMLGSSFDEDGVGMLEDIYRKSNDPELKQAALQGLMMAGNSEVFERLFASESNPDLRRQIVHMLGISGSHDTLREMYGAADKELKGQILESLGIGGDEEFLLQVLRQENDLEIRSKAIHGLGIGGSETAWQEMRKVYNSSNDKELKMAILQASAINGHGHELVVAAIRDEKDPEVRLQAIHMVGIGIESTPEVQAIIDDAYENGDMEIKKAILHSYGMSGDDARLIRVAKTEKDLELRKAAVHALSMSGSDEAADFLMSLLEDN